MTPTTLLSTLKQYNALLDGKPNNLTFSREGVLYELLPKLLVDGRIVIQRALEAQVKREEQPGLFDL